MISMGHHHGPGGKRQGPSGPAQKLDRKTRNRVIIRLLSYIIKYWPLFVSAIALTLFSNQLALLGPKYSGLAIDALSKSSGVDFPSVWENVVRMIFCYVVAGVTTYVLSIMMIHLSQKIVYSMRRQLFEKLTTLPVSYFDTHATGDIISRISYDIDTVNSTLSHDLIHIMASVYTVVGSFIFMWQISKVMILIFAITVPASLIFTRYRTKKIRPLFHERSHKLGELNGYAEEMLSGSRTINAYNREDTIVSRFDKRNKDAVDAYYKAEYYGSTIGPSVNFINNLSISLITILGGALYMYSQSGAVKAGSIFFITLGSVAQFVQYSRKFSGPINEFANIINEFQSAFAAAERIFRIIDEEPEPLDNADAVNLENVEGNVCLKNIDFSYVEDKPILKNVSVEALKGKMIAIVGPTGAGKTTIINLLMRFYDIQSGEITVDGVNIKNITRSSLRKAYTMVLQDTWLFGGTIYENIVYGREDATFDEVKEATKAARIDSYIERLPEGYDTVISDDGTNISKGQRQLITIARAMLPKSPMLILDEATSNVDSRTEIKIQQAMNELMKNRTCFVIAHRLSTIQNADMILVIKDGKIAEQGNHDELMKLGGFYSTLYNSQFS